VALLLDTHLLLWALTQPARLKSRVRSLIDEHEVFVSSASIWEISIKSSLGKLEANPHLVLQSVAASGMRLLPISGEHAAKVFELPNLHRDRFDRLLLAQALCDALTLLTDDAALGPYGSYVTVV